MGKRNTGIDLLRIVLMIMICTQHLLEYGGVLTANLSNSNYIVANGIYQFSLCAVNCYGLISGYISIDRKVKYMSIINLWFIAFFYSFLVSFIFYLIRFIFKLSITMSFLDLLKSFFPVCFGNWYFRAYFLLFFFMPIVDSFIKKIDEHSSKMLLYLFFMFSFLSLFTDEWFNNGYSSMWLLYLYVIGALVRKSNFLTNIKRIHLIFFYLFVFVTNCLLIRNGHFIFGIYTSPSVLFMAIVLLLYFSRSSNENSSIYKLSQHTFGVYLLHDNSYIRDYLINNSLIGITQLSPPLFTIFLVLSITLLFLFSLIIDIIRSKIFKLINIRDFCTKISNKLEWFLSYE